MVMLPSLFKCLNQYFLFFAHVMLMRGDGISLYSPPLFLSKRGPYICGRPPAVTSHTPDKSQELRESIRAETARRRRGHFCCKDWREGCWCTWDRAVCLWLCGETGCLYMIVLLIACALSLWLLAFFFFSQWMFYDSASFIHELKVPVLIGMSINVSFCS